MDKMINIRLDDELWKKAKIAAATAGVTLKEWLTQAINASLTKEK